MQEEDTFLPPEGTAVFTKEGKLSRLRLWAARGSLLSMRCAVFSRQSCPTLCDPMVPLSMGFPRQEYWSELPFPSPGNLPDPEMESTSSGLQAGSLPLSHQGVLKALGQTGQ